MTAQKMCAEQAENLEAEAKSFYELLNNNAGTLSLLRKTMKGISLATI